VDRFRDEVDAFVRDGGRSATVLHARLKGLGCPASYHAVRRFLVRRLEAAGVSPAGAARGPPRPRRPTARQLSFEYVRRPEDRSEEAAGRVALVDQVEELRSPLGLVREFLGLARRESQGSLSDWLSRADGSPDRSVQSFAASVWTDEKAVGAAFSTAWSNGPSEGHVNRLKAIKRSMYGRAGLALLRARVCAVW
jgi:transposase